MSTVAPIALEQIPPEWIEERREIIAREGRALRAGPAATVEIKSVTPHDQLAAHDPLRLNAWVALALPGGAVQCTTAAERDALLTALTEGRAP